MTTKRLLKEIDKKVHGKGSKLSLMEIQGLLWEAIDNSCKKLENSHSIPKTKIKKS